MRTAEPGHRAGCHPGHRPGRRAPLALAACASACIAAGCGAPIVDMTPEDAAARDCLARLEIPKAAETLNEIDEHMDETYPAEAWSAARKPFKPHYHEITDAEAFSWSYLEKLAADRSKLLRKTRDELAEQQRKVRQEEQKEAAGRRKADIKVRKAAKRRATVKGATTGEAVKVDGTDEAGAGGKKATKRKATKRKTTRKRAKKK